MEPESDKLLMSVSGIDSSQSLQALNWIHQWIGLRENLQETIVFTIKYGGFL